MIFINGILQPPGSDKAYTAYSNKIEFNEPPETGATFQDSILQDETVG